MILPSRPSNTSATSLWNAGPPGRLEFVPGQCARLWAVDQQVSNLESGDHGVKTLRCLEVRRPSTDLLIGRREAGESHVITQKRVPACFLFETAESIPGWSLSSSLSFLLCSTRPFYNRTRLKMWNSERPVTAQYRPRNSRRAEAFRMGADQRSPRNWPM